MQAAPLGAACFFPASRATLPPMPIRCITFDWGDTLAANYGMPYDFAQRRAFAGLGRDLAAAGAPVPAGWLDEVLAAFGRLWRESGDPATHPTDREIDLETHLQAWIRAAGPCCPMAAAAARERFEITCTDLVRPYGGTTQALAGLKAAGYRLGVLSHVAWPAAACRRWFERWGLARHLDFYSFSSEVGWIKPDRRHFEHAIGLAGCAPHEILHVGDHPRRDVEGGRAQGLRTCLRMTEHMHRPEALAACRPDAVIAFVDEVAEVARRL